MDKEIRNIFENYQDTWSLSPKESFKRDKEFFQYVIESNPHLAPLREFKLKYIFELYKMGAYCCTEEYIEYETINGENINELNSEKSTSSLHVNNDIELSAISGVVLL